MQFSPPFARNAKDFVSLCLDRDDRPVLVSEELISNGIPGLFDTSQVVKVPKHYRDWIVPLPTAWDRGRVVIEKFIIDGRYLVHYGVGHYGNQRVIVSYGTLEKLPPVDVDANMP
jgi:hypothetical protein